MMCEGRREKEERRGGGAIMRKKTNLQEKQNIPSYRLHIPSRNAQPELKVPV
jgi:hypothetical protein